MNIIIGAVIVGVTLYFLFRNYDIKLVLIASGLLLAGIALDPLAVLDEFAQKMVTDSLIQAVCSSMGFAFVMKETGCMRHLEAFVCNGLKRTGYLVVPLMTVLTFVVNSILLSAANTAAALGIIAIPLMIRTGVHPALAATVILSGTFGSMLNPATHTNPFVARVSGKEIDAVIAHQGSAVILGIAVVAVCLTLVAVFTEEYKGYISEDSDEETRVKKANPLFALVALLPLIILLLGASNLVPSLQMGIAQAMVVGTLLGVLVTGTSPATILQRFFDGMGSAYGNAMGLIIAVAVFTQGMKSIGLVSSFITWMTTTPGMALLGGIVGPFMMGVMVGSGDAAAFAFIEAVAPHAVLYRMETIDMACMAAIAAALGRTMSPFAAATIVCASIAKVSPLEIVKRNGIGIIGALITVFLTIVLR